MDITVKLYRDESKKKVVKQTYCDNIHYAQFVSIPKDEAEANGFYAKNGLDDMNEYLEIEQEDSSLIFFPLSKIRYEVYGTKMSDGEKRKKTKWLIQELKGYKNCMEVIRNKLINLGVCNYVNELTDIIADLDIWIFKYDIDF